MLMRVWEDRCGNVLAEPVSARREREILRDLAAGGLTFPVHIGEPMIFAQDGMGSADVLALLTRSAREMVGRGYIVHARWADDTVRALVGLCD